MTETTTLTYADAYEAILADEVDAFVNGARKGFAVAQQEFSSHVAEGGVMYAMQWRAEGLIRADLLAKLADIIEIEMGGSLTEAVRQAHLYLDQAVAQGVDSGWSGHMTNEAYRTRGKQALELKERGPLDSLISSAKYGAVRQVADQSGIHAADRNLREYQGKLDRARSAERKHAASGSGRGGKTRQERAKAAYLQAKIDAGVPEDLL